MVQGRDVCYRQRCTAINATRIMSDNWHLLSYTHLSKKNSIISLCDIWPIK